MQIVGKIVDRLLTIGIADPEVSIRSIVLSSLDDRFDNHLAQTDSVRAIFIALNDESFAIRELAMVLLARLSVHNPPLLMPSLRKILIQLLTELEYSSKSLQKKKLLDYCVCLLLDLNIS